MKWPWNNKKAGASESADRAADDEQVLSTTILSGDAEQDSRSLEILLDTIAAVTANIDLDSVLSDIVARSLQVTSAERALLLLGEEPEQLKVRVAQDKEGKSLSGDLQWSRSLVKRCLDEGVAVRSVVQSDQEALELGRSVFDLKLRAVMCAPMRSQDRTVGVIYVDSRAVRREFSARDQALFGAISAQLAISVENARLHADSLEKAKLEKDVEIARRIQQHLLPPLPKDAGLDIALRYEAAEQASGDTYDIVPMAGGRYAIMIGDVTGHGVGAALLTHAVQAALRSYLELIDDAATVVSKMNQRLVDGVETGNFMSLILAIVDPAARTIEYVNAGHPGLVVCQRGGVQVLEKTGMVLGVVGDQVYEAGPPVAFEPDDLIFLHTDGVDESMSPAREVFGVERLQELVGALRQQDLDAGGVLTEVERQIRDHVGSDVREDDFTMIAVKLA
ncbi:MAG: GAF domain-containing SpoIIE family protein phosphatase [Planctomycetota bacterium]|nr:GAF domain-containing SpoIIE family protein phosphatase [Planctomycetota bacterium]MEC9048854.1 GAF domain-containing SpoIIE family protein phosphatase [Planctomycetota bacterium]